MKKSIENYMGLEVKVDDERPKPECSPPPFLSLLSLSLSPSANAL